MKCETVFETPGPNEGCAEFAGPEEFPCNRDAVAVVVLTDPYPYPGDSDEIRMTVCDICARELEQSPHYRETIALAAEVAS